MRRITKLALVVLVVGAVGAVLARLKRPRETPAGPSDERTEELRRKLAEARAAAADQDDFEAAGMGAETIVEEETPRAEPAGPVEAQAEAAGAPEPEAAGPEPKPEPEPEAEEPEKKSAQPSSSEPPPQDEFEAMRQRVHREGKAAAEEMRRSADPPEKP